MTPAVAALGPQREPQVCYVLLTLGRAAAAEPRAINWAFVADASRSMRIPIVDDAQFRALIREGGAQETLVDGVPVWQLSGPIPPEVRAQVKSPLDYVVQALHALLERLDNADRFALIACAEEAVVLAGSAPGDARGALATAINHLGSLNLGSETDLAKGMTLGLQELRRGRARSRSDRLILLTDGFTQNAEQCEQLATAAAEQSIAITTLGIGGEFQTSLLTELADRTGGAALFVETPADIYTAVAHELATARATATGECQLMLTPRNGTLLRRVTRIRPTLSTLHEQATAEAVTIRGDAESLLIELVAPAYAESRAALAEIALVAQGVPHQTVEFTARRYAHIPEPPAPVRDAAARANIARLQQRAHAAATAGNTAEAKRLLQTIAARLDELGAGELAEASRQQAAALAQTHGDTLGMKELTYATRRL